MKSSILAIILSLAVISCGSTKNTNTSDEKNASAVAVENDSICRLNEMLENAKKQIESMKSKKSVTEIKYKPEIDPLTGLAKPFNYETKENGKSKTSVHVDGNGEVNIRTEEEETLRIKEEYEQKIQSITSEYETKFAAQAATIKSLETKSEKKTTGTSCFWHWVWMIGLGLLLIASIVMHIYRTKIPFLNRN